MRIDRETLIAAIVIFILMVGGFLAFQIFIANSGVNIVQDGSILITPLAPQEETQQPTAQIETAEILLGVFSKGLPVVITNTGGDGLRIRNAPGLDSTPLFLGADGEEFTIVDGPSLIDSRIWWKIESVADETRTGWAVQDYLSVHQ